MVYRIELCRCLCRGRRLRLYASEDVWVEAAACDASACFGVLAWLASLCFALMPCLGFIALFALPCLCASPGLAFFCLGALPCRALPCLTLPCLAWCHALPFGVFGFSGRVTVTVTVTVGERLVVLIWMAWNSSIALW